MFIQFTQFLRREYGLLCGIPPYLLIQSHSLCKKKVQHFYYCNLTFFLRNGQENIVNVLIRRGSNPNAKDQFDSTPLLWGSWAGRVFKWSKSIDSKLIGNLTSLGRENMVRLLIRAGGRVSARNVEGDTPLIYNSEHGE